MYSILKGQFTSATTGSWSHDTVSAATPGSWASLAVTGYVRGSTDVVSASLQGPSCVYFLVSAAPDMAYTDRVIITVLVPSSTVGTTTSHSDGSCTINISIVQFD